MGQSRFQKSYQLPGTLPGTFKVSEKVNGYSTLSGPDHDNSINLSSCHCEEHVAMVVSFVVLDFVRGSSGCVL